MLHSPAKADPRTVQAGAAANVVRRIGFCLVPDFSFIAFASAIEPLRLANRHCNTQHYAWHLLSDDGLPVTASNGVSLAVDGAVAEAGPLHMLLVAAGIDVEQQDHTALIRELRRRAVLGAKIGALCTGAHILARGGLLDGHRATIHWENRIGLQSAFPQLSISEELFEIDRNRLTCAGGTAALDMMLSLITSDLGIDVASAVTDQLIHHRIRDKSEVQRTTLQTRHGVAQPRMIAIVQRMQTSIDAPLSCSRLAREAGISVRQLERMFRRAFAQTPARYYLNMRLDHARRLLRQTSMSVIDVSLATGFESASHFSKSYGSHFGVSPSSDRTANAPA
ncbi:MAG TPA: GlxA family transcriptional regulator [Beijerinckiaceae bacterium]|nr:GlxA family transcriptional regulator [Beijerinckiaceae bacterium]